MGNTLEKSPCYCGEFVAFSSTKIPKKITNTTISILAKITIYTVQENYSPFLRFKIAFLFMLEKDPLTN
jgi:hypothetical protein